MDEQNCKDRQCYRLILPHFMLRADMPVGSAYGTPPSGFTNPCRAVPETERPSIYLKRSHRNANWNRIGTSRQIAY